MKRRIFSTKLIAGVALTFFLTSFGTLDTANAGTIIPRARRLDWSGGLRTRSPRKSTDAIRSLNSVSGTHTSTLRDTSPYDYRIKQMQQANDQYNRDLEKYNFKLQQAEAKNAAAAEKKRLAVEKQAKKDKEKEDARLAKLERQRQRQHDRENRGTSLFRSSTSSPEKAEAPAVVDSAQTPDKKAEAFFGANAEPGKNATASNAQAAGRPNFWQRLKRALFGGA